MIKVRDTRYGRMMYLSNDRFIGRSLDLYGEAHFHEVEMLKQLLSPGDVVIDAGANIGVVAVPLAQHVGHNGYVVAIEAQPFLFNVLCGNLALNNLHNAQPLNRAVAGASGQIAFIPDLDYQGHEFNFGSVSLSSEPDKQKGSNTRPISTIAVDDLKLSSLKLLKIDVEGMELSVLSGATETIKRTKPFIYIEFISNQTEILKSLRDLNYVWKLHTPAMFNKTNFENNPNNVLLNDQGHEIVSGDLLCWHKDAGKIDVQSDFFVDLDGVE